MAVNTIFAVVLLSVGFALSSEAQAQASTKKNLKTGKDAVVEAEELVLESQRIRALTLLTKEWESAKGPAKTALSQRMEELARIFITERGQKAFELGQSMPVEKSNIAETHYNEALKTEDGNVSVLQALATLKIRERSWNQALDALENILKILPSSREIEILKLRTLLASSQYDEAEKLVMKLGGEAKRADYEDAYLEFLLKTEKTTQAEPKISELLKKQPQLPEAHYLKLRLDEAKARPSVQSAERYLELCKNLTPLSQKKLRENPFKCLDQPAVQKIVDEFESQTR